jgi:hypothetical protein
MRNEAMAQLDVLVGSWQTTMQNAWFLEPADQEVAGSATGLRHDIRRLALEPESRGPRPEWRGWARSRYRVATTVPCPDIG